MSAPSAPGGLPPDRLPPGRRVVASLLDEMVAGREYQSIIDAVMQGDLVAELRRGIAQIEVIRQRPCVCYVANMIKEVQGRSLDPSDHLPFVEMLTGIAPEQKRVDVFLATPGGSPHTVAQLVEALRARFDEVDFLIPAQAMSAGTLWALSGDNIWMTNRAYLGPIDPQVPGRDGRYLPVQALLTLLATIQRSGEERMKKGLQPEWSHVMLLRNMDQKELGDAITFSRYVTDMAAGFIEKYKFRKWVTHSTTGNPVTDDERTKTAATVAGLLCSHERWKAHGHSINRTVLKDEVRLRIELPESVAGLESAMHRLWALWYYLFDKANVAKVMLSAQYSLLRGAQG